MRLLVHSQLAALLAVFVVGPAGGQSLSGEPTLAEETDFVPPPLLAVPSASAESVLSSDEGVGAAQAELVEEVLPLPGSTDAIAFSGPLLREQHPWARHSPGAWRRQRIVQESFDDRGVLVGRSETVQTERLIRVDTDSYTLRVETVVDVGGRRVPGPPQELTLGFLSETPGVAPALLENEPATINLGGRAIPCELWMWVTETDRGEVRETIDYAAGVAPHVLKRERQELVDGDLVSEETVRVVRTGAPIELGGRLEASHQAAAERVDAGGAVTERHSVYADRIPGGLFSEGVTERDAAGRLVRWTHASLIAFGETAETVRQAVKAAAPVQAAPAEVRPRRWFRMLRRGGIRISDDDLDDLEDEIEDYYDDLEDAWEDRFDD